jgi:hypothetical protein
MGHIEIFQSFRPHVELTREEIEQVERGDRSMLDVRIEPLHMYMTGSLKEGDFQPLATGTIQVNEETVLGLLRKGVSELSVRSSFYVGLSERAQWRMPVATAIERFMFTAGGIIAQFDC